MKIFPNARFHFVILAFYLTLLLVTGCEKKSENPSGAPLTTDQQPSTETNPPATEPPPAVVPPANETPAPPETSLSLTPPLWETVRKSDGAEWTNYAYDVVKNYGTALMAGSQDMKSFCPNYAKLPDEYKMNFWVYLVSAMVKYESGFDPTNRYVETTMGTDPVTGEQVASEGLMQLSYQDGLNYLFCDEFDWTQDKYLSSRDPNKTILDPYKNLKCGIRILNQLVLKKDMISFSSGQYWSVLKPTSASQPKIRALTNSLNFCKL